MKVLKAYYQWENKKATEVMKYELGVEIMKEFAWLKPKMCSYIKNNDKKIKNLRVQKMGYEKIN